MQTRKARLALHVLLSLLALAGMVAPRAAASGPPDAHSASAAPVADQPGPASPLAQNPSAPTVTLHAVSGATIPFATHNGQTEDGSSPRRIDLPHLVLTRNGTLTDPIERTLVVELAGLQSPPSGATVTLEIETQHGSPDRGPALKERIPVWRETQVFAILSGSTQRGATVRFTPYFTGTVVWGAQSVPTPTDYYHARLTVQDAAQPQAEPLLVWDQEFAFLLESQWVTPLPAVPEESTGAAPDELIVYYCDMFPFWKNIADPGSWLPRGGITAYVGQDLVPALVEAFRVQSQEWAFVWYDAWTSYRLGEDAERLSVALTTPDTWFHGPAPRRANSSISLRIKGGDNADYDTLTEGLLSSFHHELFHNLQRNISQGSGGDGNVVGLGNAWSLFAEGTAVLASSVGQPALQFAPASERRAYLYRAEGFLVGGEQGGGDLNTSYAGLNPYDAALYWRFLYERCGGLAGGAEDAAAGMAVIRRVLHTLYAGQVVDILSSTDVVQALPAVMDRALAGSTCPFQSYDQSLVAFAQAIYGLRLGGGFHDPHNQYPIPPFDTVPYAGGKVAYVGGHQDDPAGIPSSFGIDLVEVVLSPAAQGQRLTLELHGAPGAVTRFRAQLWTLRDSGAGAPPVALSAPLSLLDVHGDGVLSVALAAADTTHSQRLGLAIVRVDADEALDALGAYILVLRQAAP